MRVLIVSENDWANVGYGFQIALANVGVRAKAICFNKHIFNYERQALHVTAMDKLVQLSKWCDTILFMHSQKINLPLGHFDIAKKKTFVFHGGTAYRNTPKQISNEFDEAGITTALIQNYDLMGIGCPGIKEISIMPAVDELLKYDHVTKNPLVVAHHPRGVDIKGTSDITEVLSNVKNIKVNISDPGFPVSWKDNINRLKECDIYVSALPQNGVTGIGVTALEAAALGKIVISPCADIYQYIKDFGEPFFFTVNDKNELLDQLNNILDCDIESLKKQTRKRVIESHGYKATGERLYEIFQT